VPRRRQSDPLTEFSHRLAQIKFIIFEIAILGIFLYGLYRLVRLEVGF
jgi:hypothetical protein